MAAGCFGCQAHTTYKETTELDYEDVSQMRNLFHSVLDCFDICEGGDDSLDSDGDGVNESDHFSEGAGHHTTRCKFGA